MENAAKALLIVGQVLIAILLLTLLSYLFTKMHADTTRIQETMEQNKKIEFNQQFLIYDGIQNRVIGYENGDQTKPIMGFLTAQDVATIINLAIDNNNNAKFPTIIKVMYGGKNLAENEDIKEWLSDKVKIDAKYGCTVYVNPSTLLVEKIDINDI